MILADKIMEERKRNGWSQEFCSRRPPALSKCFWEPEKNDGSRIDLRITGYAPESSDNAELLWIFMDESEEK